MARILFQPVEETSRVFFSKTLSAPTASALSTTSSMLALIFSLHALLLLVFAALLPPFTHLVLSLALSPAYTARTSAPVVLAAYCYYLPIMGFNGIAEAFVQAVASEAELQSQTKRMIGFSLIFLLSVLALVRGAGMVETGLVWANCVNLGCRFAYSWGFIKSYYSRQSLESQASAAGEKVTSSTRLTMGAIMPTMVTMSVFIAAGGICRWSEEALYVAKGDRWTHLGIGAASGLVCLGVR